MPDLRCTVEKVKCKVVSIVCNLEKPGLPLAQIMFGQLQMSACELRASW